MKNKCVTDASSIKEMTGHRTMFRCYRKVIPEKPHDIETLIDSHDNLFIIPAKKLKHLKRMRGHGWLQSIPVRFITVMKETVIEELKLPVKWKK